MKVLRIMKLWLGKLSSHTKSVEGIQMIIFGNIIVEYFPHSVKKFLQKGVRMFEQIQRFCETQDLTIEQFERAIGVSPGYVYKLKGKHKPSYRVAKKIATLLDKSIEEFVEGSE